MIAMVQRNEGAKRRQKTEPDRCIFRKTIFKIVRECLRQPGIPRESKRKRNGILHIPAMGEVKCRQSASTCLRSVPEKTFPQCCSGFVLSGPFPMAPVPRG